MYGYVIINLLFAISLEVIILESILKIKDNYSYLKMWMFTLLQMIYKYKKKPTKPKVKNAKGITHLYILSHDKN